VFETAINLVANYLVKLQEISLLHCREIALVYTCNESCTGENKKNCTKITLCVNVPLEITCSKTVNLLSGTLEREREFNNFSNLFWLSLNFTLHMFVSCQMNNITLRRHPPL